MPAETKQTATGGFFVGDTAAAPSPPAGEAIEWTASEFIHHEKGMRWYLGLSGITLVGTTIIFLLTGDKMSVSMIIIVAIIFGVLAGRKPQVASYKIDSQGLVIGGKSHPWSFFKSFAVMEEGGISSIYLLPLKRFTPPAGMYFDPRDEERIISAIGSYLPQIERQHDSIDRLMHRLRF